jgi:hypothetical protein
MRLTSAGFLAQHEALARIAGQSVLRSLRGAGKPLSPFKVDLTVVGPHRNGQYREADC